jgi:pimeloyl-ACP methyl ester carboxylesterase
MIHYDVHGSADPALVFVHCWSGDRSYWDGQIDQFAEKYRVITVDLAGHGQSGLNRDIWSMASFGADVAAVVEKLGLEKVILIGHSMGGAVIVEAARQLPDKVIGLIGVDTYHNLSLRYADHETESFLRPFREHFQSATSHFIRAMFPDDADSALVERVVSDLSSAPPEVGTGAFEEMFKYYFADRMGLVMVDLNLPVICINSDKNPTKLEIGRQLAPSFEAKIMQGVGHFVMLEDAQTFNVLLHEAVQELISTE